MVFVHFAYSLLCFLYLVTLHVCASTSLSAFSSDTCLAEEGKTALSQAIITALEAAEENLYQARCLLKVLG